MEYCTIYMRLCIIIIFVKKFGEKNPYVSVLEMVDGTHH